MNAQEIIANKILELKRDFEVIKKLKNDISDGSLSVTMHNLQEYTRVKEQFFREVNKVQLESLSVMNKIQYLLFQGLIKKFYKEL